MLTIPLNLAALLKRWAIIVQFTEKMVCRLILYIVGRQTPLCQVITLGKCNYTTTVIKESKTWSTWNGEGRESATEIAWLKELDYNWVSIPWLLYLFGIFQCSYEKWETDSEHMKDGWRNISFPCNRLQFQSLSFLFKMIKQSFNSCQRLKIPTSCQRRYNGIIWFQSKMSFWLWKSRLAYYLYNF